MLPSGIQQGKKCWTCGTNFETSKHNFIKNIEKLGGKVIGKYINSVLPVECICKNGHTFWPFPSSIQQGRNCGRCKNKTEGKIMNFLQSLRLSIISQATFPWCRNPKTSSLYLYDFYLPDLKILIEIDGRQHFQQVSNWVAPEVTNERDLYKISCAVLNGFTIIHMCQDEIWNDKINWKEQLQKELYLRLSPEFLIISQNLILHNALRALADIVFEDIVFEDSV